MSLRISVSVCVCGDVSVSVGVCLCTGPQARTVCEDGARVGDVASDGAASGIA